MIHAQTGTPAIRRRRNERLGSLMIDGGGVTGPRSLGGGNSGGGRYDPPSSPLMVER